MKIIGDRFYIYEGEATVKAIFKNESEIKDYILNASLNPDNVKVISNGSRILNYRSLTTHIGVSCYIIFQNQILILERSPLVNFGGTWGTVSGYVDNLDIVNESKQILRDHILQELQEEIGWDLDDSMELIYRNQHVAIAPKCNIHFELFTLSVTKNPPEIKLNPEHLSYRWIEVSKIKSLKDILITQFLEGLEKCDC